MNKHHIILLIFFIIAFSVASLGTRATYDLDGDNFYEKFTLRGPDSYYNLKMCKYQLAGNYDIYDYDLSYPHGDRQRPLLYTTITTNLALFVHTVSGIDIPDALGWTMLLIPCLFGALLVFPVYGIAHVLFNKNIALLSAFFVIIIPYLYDASHGSLAGLFDHDSFLSFFIVLFYFSYIKLISSEDKRTIVSYLCLTVISLSAIYMTWVVHYYIVSVIGAFIFVYLYYTTFKKKNPLPLLSKTALMFCITFVVTLWYAINYHFFFNIFFIGAIGTISLFLIYFLLKVHKRSLRTQLGLLMPISAISIIIIYSSYYLYELTPLLTTLATISKNIFIVGIYETKILSTIQEAQVPNLTVIMLNYGFILFITAILGGILYAHKLHRDKIIKSHLFFVVIFIITVYFSTVAARFAKDLLPFVAIFSALFLYAFIKEINLKKLKELRVKQLVSCTLIFLVVASSIFITTTNVTSKNMFNEKEWVDISFDIKEQFEYGSIFAWWDYGFYLTTITDYPVVSDNFQNGIYVTSNFFTAQSEKEALDVLSVYLIRAELKIYNKLYQPSLDVIHKHLRVYYCKPCNKYSLSIANEFIDVINHSSNNDIYSNALSYLSHKTIQESYEIFEELQISTGFSLDYFIVNEREIDAIKVIPAYLADKTNVGFSEVKDDWFEIVNGEIENRQMFNNSFVVQLYEEKNLKYFEKIYERGETKMWRIKE